MVPLMIVTMIRTSTSISVPESRICLTIAFLQMFATANFVRRLVASMVDWYCEALLCLETISCVNQDSRASITAQLTV